MQLGGLSVSQAFDASVGLSGLMVVGNLCGTILVEKFGRRFTALYGTVVLCITLFLIGILASIPSSKVIWGQVAFMAVWSFGKLRLASLWGSPLTIFCSIPSDNWFCSMANHCRKSHIKSPCPLPGSFDDDERIKRMHLGFRTPICDQPRSRQSWRQNCLCICCCIGVCGRVSVLHAARDKRSNVCGDR